MDAQEIFARIRRLRTEPQPETRRGVPEMLPVGGLIGREFYMKLPGRTLRAVAHRPKADGGSVPAYINFHGGGFNRGSAEMDEPMCARICKLADCIVFNVEYRLAPEYPFPCGLDDCCDAVAEVFERAADYGVDVRAVAVGGQSAGGTLAAGVIQRMLDTGKYASCGYVLTYPALDFGSPITMAEDAAIHKAEEGLYRAAYGLGGADLTQPYVTPINAQIDRLRGAPAVLILSAGLDTLRHGAYRFAAMLREAGVNVDHYNFENCVHGFTHRAYRTEPEEAVQKIAAFLRGRFAAVR